MSAVYCGACGAGLRETAKFCPACGSPQEVSPPPREPPPPSPAYAPPPAYARAATGSPPPLDVIAAVLAIVGGAGMCFIALYATIYLPLHHDFGVNYGESVRIGDALAVASGLVAVAIGVLVLARPGSNRMARGVWLLAAGTPTLIAAVVWSFPQTFHVTIFPEPFYFAYVFFTDLGVTHIGTGYVPLPLVGACAMVIGAGLATFSSLASRPAVATHPR